MLIVRATDLFRKSLWFLLAFIFTAALCYAYPNEPDGFRGHPWQTLKSEFGLLLLQENLGGWQSYRKPNEDMNFYGMKAQRILYGFAEDRLTIGMIEINSKDKAALEAVKAGMIKDFGEGQNVGEADVMWAGARTYIKFGYTGDGAEIFFSDSRKGQERESRRDTFIKQLQEQWLVLLKEYDAPQAQARLSNWIKVNGKGVVSRHNFNNSGGGLSLNMTGGGIMLVDPPFDSSARNLESEKIYSVGEIVLILDRNPAGLRDKDVIVRGVIVNGVGGMGCDDFEIITDQQFVELYSRQHKGNLTAQEKQAVMNIPQLVIVPASPQRIRFNFKGENVLRGHFFDPGMKACKNGARRFVVTEVE